MREKGIINEKTELELYNWGEPFLNPEINDICGIIVKYGYSYHLSTNASVMRKISPENLRTLSGFRVSLSGFSEETYSITHALNYSQVISNISEFYEMLKAAGKHGLMDISFLVYKFNVGEIEKAREYFSSLGIGFTPRLAYYADYEQFQMFLNGNMPSDVKALSEKHIFESLWRARARQAPERFACPQMNFIVTDHKWNIIPCCRLTENDNIGNVFDMELEDIVSAKRNVFKCRECKETNQHYIVHSPSLFKFSIDPPKTEKFVKVPKLYYDTGEGFSEAQVLRKGSINDDSGLFYAEYSFPQKPVRVRFDPVEGEYCILDEFYAASNTGEIKWTGTNGTFNDGVFYFDNFDPQIIIKDVNASKLIISARIHGFKNLALLHAVRNLRKNGKSE